MTDCFIVSAASGTDPAAVIGEALRAAGIVAEQVDAAVVSVDPSAGDRATGLVQQFGGSATAVLVLGGLQALITAAQAISAGDAHALLVSEKRSGEICVLALASPDAIGKLNLMPRARIAGRSLTGLSAALKAAEIESAELAVDGVSLDVARKLLDQLDGANAQWGCIRSGKLALVLERL